MTTNARPDLQDTGTTDDRDETDDCDCSPLLACFEHYGGDRGRPAIRRVN